MLACRCCSSCLPSCRADADAGVTCYKFQDAAHGKNYRSDKVSGARRLRNAIVLGFRTGSPLATSDANNATFFHNTLLADDVVRVLLHRVPQNSPATLLGYHRFSIKGRVYPAILPVENKKITGRVLLDITDPELDILDKFEDFEYEKRIVDVSLLDSSEVLKAYTYVWVNNDDPALYGEWDFEVWKESKMKDFLNMTMGFVEEQELPESKPRVATYESYYNHNDGNNLSS